ncbi:MAG: TRAP transporter substrate-binding protein [Acetobacteraceae bacterium]
MPSSTRRVMLKSVLAATAGGLAAPYIVRAGFAAAPVHTLKLVFADTVSHPIYQVCLRFAENVRKKTDGGIKVEVYGAGQLVPENDMMSSLQTGIVDLCAHTSGFVQTLYPSFMAVDLPFLFSSVGKAEKMLDGPVGTRLLSDLPAKGVYGLSYGWWGWRVVDARNRPVAEPKDMHGLKIRVQAGAVFATTFKTLKAIPVAIAITEVYLALSDGTIGAVEVPIISVLANKFQEVVKVITDTNHDYNVGVMMASKRKLDALDKNYQEAIRQAALEMTPDWRRTIGDASAEAAKVIAAKGVKTIQADRVAYRKAVEPVYQQYRPIIGPKLMDAVLKAAA